jgi:hypothetical protein
MTKWATSILVCLVVACAPSPSSLSIVAPMPNASESLLHVVGSYTATLVWALEGAAEASPQSSSRGGEYRAWLALPADDPDLLTFRSRPRDAPFDQYFECSFVAVSVDELLACTRRVFSATDAEVVVRLLARAHAALWPCWKVLAPELGTAVAELRSLSESTAVRETISDLRRAATLPVNERLAATIVLVANPSATQSRGTGVANTYVVEIDHLASRVEQLGIIVHELTHLAQTRSNASARVEGALVGRGMAGVVAASVWVEASAAAFGNGLCVGRLAPSTN